MNKKRETFSVGDIVRLKSGGPDMTVVELPSPLDSLPSLPREGVVCEWFEGQKRRKGTFLPEVLEAAPKARKKT